MHLRRKLKISVFGVAALLISCSERTAVEHPATKKAVTCAHCEEINRLEQLLPVLYANDQHIVIWRFGSIQLAHYVSGLIIRKDDVGSEGIRKAVYFTFDYPQPANSNAGRAVSFYNIDIKMQKMNYMSKATTLNELDAIAETIVVDEGFCSNVFLMKEWGQETIYPVNKHATLSKEVFFLFSQISASEHLQALTLIDKCKDDSIVNRIYHAYQLKEADNYLLITDPKN